MDKKIVIIGLVAALIIGAGGVYAWRAAKSKTSNADNSRAASNGNRSGGSGVRGGQRGANFTTTSGKIADKDDKSITLNLADGGSVIVFYSASTRISKSADLTVSDLAAGQTIMARGTKNSDGNIEAVSVQSRPAGPTAAGGAPSGTGQPRTQGRDQANQDSGRNGDDLGGAGGGFVGGEIVTIEGSTITVKLSDGSQSKIVISDQTKVSKTEDASATDLVKEIEVSVTGTKAADGSIIAQMIMIGGAGAFGAPVPPVGGTTGGAVPGGQVKPVQDN